MYVNKAAGEQLKARLSADIKERLGIRSIDVVPDKNSLYEIRLSKALTHYQDALARLLQETAAVPDKGPYGHTYTAPMKFFAKQANHKQPNTLVPEHSQPPKTSVDDTAMMRYRANLPNTDCFDPVFLSNDEYADYEVAISSAREAMSQMDDSQPYHPQQGSMGLRDTDLPDLPQNEYINLADHVRAARERFDADIPSTAAPQSLEYLRFGQVQPCFYHYYSSDFFQPSRHEDTDSDDSFLEESYPPAPGCSKNS
jgi:hypothetical protein